MKITIDTSDIIKRGASSGGVAGILGRKLKEKADRKAIESKAKSPFAPLVRQQKLDAMVRNTKNKLKGAKSDYEMKRTKQL